MTMQAVIVILVVSQAIVASAFGRSNVAEGTDLGALCSGKSIDLVSASQLKSLVDQLDGGDELACSDRVRKALVDLNVLYETDREDVCTMKKVDQIKDYFSHHLSDAIDDGGVQASKIPKSLEQFAIAYAMQINSHCKLNMMLVLFQKGVDPLSSADFNELEEWTRDGGPMGNLLAAIGKKGEIILPGDLVAVMPDKTLIKKLAVQTSASGKLKRAKEVCSKRFKPVYEPVVTPVAALSRAGFDLPDVLLKIHKPERVEVLYEGMSRWSRVVFLCEVLDLVEPSLGELGVAPKKPAFNMWPNLEPVVYKAEPSGGISNYVIPSYDSKLKQLLKSFSTSKSEFERTKDKLIKRSWSLLKSRFKHGEYMAMFKLALDKLTAKVGSADAQNSDRNLEVINREITASFEPKKQTQADKLIGSATKPVRRYAQSIVALMTIFEVLKDNSLLTFKELNELRNESLEDSNQEAQQTQS